VWALAEGGYLVSNTGKVFNKGRCCLLSGHCNKEGYTVIGPKLVHRMVVGAFRESAAPHEVVHHIDEDRSNNALYNLETLSRKEHGARQLGSGRSLPANAGEIVCAVIEKRLPQSEACRQLDRSPVWLWFRLVQEGGKSFLASPELTSEERSQAQADAEEGKETFWSTWPDRKHLQVSNLGNLRYTKDGRPATAHPVSKQVSYLRAPGGGDVHIAVALIYRGPKPTLDAVVRHYPDPDLTDNRACNLLWGSYAQNAQDSVQQGLIRSGEDHPRAQLSNAQVEEGLRRFVEESWSIKDLATFLGDDDTRNTLRILEGRGWKAVRRPAKVKEARAKRGRKGSLHHLSHLTEDQVADAFTRYVEEHWSGVRFGEHLDISQLTAHQILSGRTWKHVPRPMGFQYPWPGVNARRGEQHGSTKLRDSDVERVLFKITQDYYKSVLEVSRALGLSKSATHALIAGRSWGHLLRPAGFQTHAKKLTRRVLPADVREGIIERLAAGEEKQVLVSEFDLSPSQIERYTTKARKEKEEPHIAPRAPVP